MRVLLFDLYSSGHHLEFASELRSGLLDLDPSLSVDFLTLAPAERHDMYFDSDEISYLYEESPLEAPAFVPDREPFPKIARYVSSQMLNNRWHILQDFVEYVESEDYDAIHFPEVDKIHPYLLYHLADASIPPAVGSINGFFFKPQRTIIPPSRPLREVLGQRTTRAFVRFVPQTLRNGPEWNRWFLNQCFETGVLDHVFVYSMEAKENLVSTVGPDADEWISVTPDPLEQWNATPDARTEARRRIDLPEDDIILLFFGQMREEKGIDTVLRALERYDGDQCTVVLAGPPAATSEEEIDEVRRVSQVDVVTRLGYVPQSDVREYFLAADAVLIPYHRSFGPLRTSNVFQKACAANRPIIASDFGVIGRRVREWDLGLLCEPGASDDLCRAIQTFVGGTTSGYDRDRMASYADTQTYHRLATEVYRVYSTLATPDSERRT